MGDTGAGLAADAHLGARRAVRRRGRRVVGGALGAGLLAAVAIGWGAIAQAQTPDPSGLVGSKAPPLAGPNLAGPGQVDLASYLGKKPVVVVFWLNTCPHCRRDLPKINAYQRKLGRQAQIIGAALSPAPMPGPKGFETPAAAIKKLRLTIPTVLYDSNAALNPAPGEWRVAQTPTAYVISTTGTITAVLQPDATTGELTVKAINQALAATDCGCALRSGPGVA